MFRRARRKPFRRFSRGRVSSRRRQPAWRSAARGGVAEQELEQGDEVVAVPFAGLCTTRRRRACPRGDAPEEGVVVDPRSAPAPLKLAGPPLPKRRSSPPGSCTSSVPPSSPARARSRIEVAIRPGSDERAACRRPAKRPIEAAHSFTEPCPGTNAGLRWNGTRLSQSRSACQ